MIRSDTAAQEVVSMQVQKQAIRIDIASILGVSTTVRDKNDESASKQFARIVSAGLVTTFSKWIMRWQHTNKLAYCQLIIIALT